MHKIIYITILLILCSHSSIAQFGPQQIITQTANGTQIICAADIDGDGFKDVLSANKFGSNLTWYKNLNGNFGSENTIAILDQTTWISSADIDNDGDIDVLAVSSPQNRVAWYENLDGNGTFSSLRNIDGGVDGASCVIGADLDNDGDLDAISADDFGNTIAWYENLNGQGNFSSKKIIDNTIGSPRFVMTADIDGDGDMDVLGNGTGTSKAYWIENMNGLGSFGTRHTINNAGAYLNVVIPADADGDGDMDAFSASPFDKEVAWYENLDGFGNFGPKNTIINTLVNAWTVYTADLDNDGDIDVLATSVETFGGEIVWFENLDGQGNYSAKKIISTEVQSPRSVIAADIDNDGDMDVIASSQNDDKIAWYENMTIIGIEENEIASFTIYPNPVKDFLNIESSAGVTIKTTILYDALGRELFKKENEASHLSFGN